MAASTQFRDFIADALADVGDIVIRPMFGAAGIFHGATMFGLIADDILYFKVGPENRPAYTTEDMAPFVYTARSNPVTMSYWTIPERLYDDRDEMTQWAKAAIDVAMKEVK